MTPSDQRSQLVNTSDQRSQLVKDQHTGQHAVNALLKTLGQEHMVVMLPDRMKLQR